MSTRRRYRKRPDQAVVAVPLDIEVQVFAVGPSGAREPCRPGDWLVQADGEVHAVAAADFDPAQRDRHEAAVPLDLDVRGFSYWKWNDMQGCKPGDWLVQNGDDVYTVDADVFAETYRRVAPGRYVKTTPVWAERASASGSIKTKEGRTHYEAGDYLVFNREDGGDGYAVKAERFGQMYESDE